MAKYRLNKKSEQFVQIEDENNDVINDSHHDQYAPVVLFVYNRAMETQRTLEHLVKNDLATESELFIFSDGPKNPQGAESVNQVRNLLKSFKHNFKTVTLTEREENLGLAKSIILGATEILEKYGKIICLEDDLISSTNFLNFVNQALNYYENTPKVFSISGYSFPINFDNNDTSDVYFTRRASSLGWATWYDRWENIDWEILDYQTFEKSRRLKFQFNKGGQDLSRMLKKQMRGEINSWAIRWCYNQFKSQQITAYAKKSKIEHIGFGDNATNLNKYDLFQTQLDDGEKLQFQFPEKPLINNAVEKQFTYKFSYLNKAKEKIRGFFH